MNSTSTTAQDSASRFRKPLLVIAMLTVFAVAVLTFLWMRGEFVSTERLRRDTEIALLRRQYAVAEKLARRLVNRTGHRATGLYFAGDAVSRQGRFDDALKLLGEISPEDGPIEMAAAFLRGEINLFQVFRLADAEQCFHRVLKSDPQHIAAHDRMAFILGLQGRYWEAEPHRLELIRHNQFGPVHLTLFALSETANENPQDIDKYAEKTPDDPQVLCRQARDALRADDTSNGRRLLERIVAAEPRMMQAQAWQGTLLARDEADEVFLAWQARLPVEADEHPDIWFARGTWLQRRMEHESAARCFLEAVRRDPNSQPGNYQLAQELLVLGHGEQAETFLHRSKLLGQLVIAGKQFQVLASTESIRTAAEMCELLGMRWEAWAWRQLLLERGALSPRDPLLRDATVPPFDRQRDSEQEFVEKLRANLDRDRVRRNERSSLPTEQVDLAAFALPDWAKFGRGQRRSTAGSAPDIARSGVSFRDVAESAGIRFQYHNGNKSGEPFDHMYKFTGGGVGVLDFDGDGLPDLYFTQGCDWPPRDGQRDFLDRLYRNTPQGQFEDVTLAARLAEDRFSQGVAVGDVDDDGFPDVYVGNIGRNRLYRNNGDGTFDDITEMSATAGNSWTTSCAVADINGDGLADIYCVNYLQGQTLFDRPCQWRDGSSRMCTPHEYEAAEDQLFLNLGDGRFVDVSRDAGIHAANGKGLGIVAADFGGSGRLGIFVANDATPNFFFANQTLSAVSPPKFEERGFLSGLAVDADGQAQACMGVAAGDADGDGRLDLFVTNFHRESNTLYSQQPGSLFSDTTRGSGLREPSFEMLGFGTQFLDGDLDGLRDLVVTNGHVSRMADEGIPFEMPPQYFRNVGGGRFVELKGTQAGSFFQGKFLGRGMARVDWNGDGREDFVVSHLETPSALVTNETRETGHFLAVSLRGVRSSRDAIGAIVIVRVGDRRMVQQVTGGDGYHASNERRLVFGLGSATRIDELEVKWPSGDSQSSRGLPADAEWLLIEGRRDEVGLPRRR